MRIEFIINHVITAVDENCIKRDDELYKEIFTAVKEKCGGDFTIEVAKFTQGDRDIEKQH